MESFMTAEEVGKVLGMTTDNVYLLIHTGLLPVLKVGRSYRWPRVEFEKWVKKNYRVEARPVVSVMANGY
jgi:excisionase family DNA binding protein